jgi:hypothetical protein
MGFIDEIVKLITTLIKLVIEFVARFFIIIIEILVGTALNTVAVTAIQNFVEDTALQVIFYVILGIADIGGIIALVKFGFGGDS